MEGARFRHREDVSIEEMSRDELNVAGWNAFLEADVDTLARAAEVARSREKGFESIGQNDASHAYDRLATSLERELSKLRDYIERGL
ncbi:hypothetical protein HY379_01010 [Candidatus Saccharibacteria bacterium]|nr:hypothetical protein [Candidatus Saccharibacteria bacterium]